MHYLACHFMSSSRLSLLTPNIKLVFRRQWNIIEHDWDLSTSQTRNADTNKCIQMLLSAGIGSWHWHGFTEGASHAERQGRKGREGAWSLTFQVKHVEANWEQLIEAVSWRNGLRFDVCDRSIGKWWRHCRRGMDKRWQENLRRMAWVMSHHG